MTGKIKRRIVLHFPRNLIDQPIVCKLVKDYDLIFNILKASITPEEEGVLVLELSGNEENFHKGINYLKKIGVKIQPLSKDVIRNEAKCTHCGACVAICPTSAFEVDTKTRKIIFHNEKCIACEICFKACPPKAMEIKLDV